MGLGGGLKLAPTLTLQLLLFHQASHPRTANGLSLLGQVSPNTTGAIDLAAALVAGLDLLSQTTILLLSPALRPLTPLVVAATGDLQGLEELDLELLLVLLDKGVLHGLYLAKYAAAFFNISRSSFKRAFSFFKRLSSS